MSMIGLNFINYESIIISSMKNNFSKEKYHKLKLNSQNS